MKTEVQRVRYNGSGGHQRAVLFLIGQSEKIFKHRASTADVAAWMNVSKPTARKHLLQLVEDGWLVKTEVQWRSNATKHHWTLNWAARSLYNSGDYDLDFQIYAQKVLKVIVQS